jgi:hypothetical protein
MPKGRAAADTVSLAKECPALPLSYAGELLGGAAPWQPSANSLAGLLDELAGPASIPAGDFAHANGNTGASGAQGASDMFGGLSLGGELGQTGFCFIKTLAPAPRPKAWNTKSMRPLPIYCI